MKNDKVSIGGLRNDLETIEKMKDSFERLFTNTYDNPLSDMYDKLENLLDNIERGISNQLFVKENLVMKSL